MQQMSIFSELYEAKVIEKPIRLIEFFAGIGAQHKALKYLTDKVESYKICEWAYNSILCYNAIHIKDFKDYSKDKTLEECINRINGISVNYNDPLTLEQIKKKGDKWIRNAYNNCIATKNLINIMNVHGKDLEIVDKDKYEYILTYSFPCQDLSLAGKRQGMAVSQKEGGTRSGLLWEVERIISELDRDHRPDILLMENVPEVVGTDNVEHFNKWEFKLEELGYQNYIQILNAKNYGIPQNRRRCFMVSILGNYVYTFPEELKLKYKLKDLLEKNVDEKYYLSERAINGRLTTNKVINDKQVHPAILARYEGAPTLFINNATKKGYLEAEEGDGIDISGRMEHHRGTVQKGMTQTLKTDGGGSIGVVIKVGNYGNGHHAKDIHSAEGIMPTITTDNHGLGQTVLVKEDKNGNKKI